MVCERYINRTQARITVKKIGQRESEKSEHEVSEETIIARLKAKGQSAESMTIHIDKA